MPDHIHASNAKLSSGTLASARQDLAERVGLELLLMQNNDSGREEKHRSERHSNQNNLDDSPSVHCHDLSSICPALLADS
jgi:hypothetical protein